MNFEEQPKDVPILITLLNSFCPGLRQIRRLREMRLRPDETLGHLYQPAADSESVAETAE